MAPQMIIEIIIFARAIPLLLIIMEEHLVRDQVGNLLTQIASLIGVDSPRTSTEPTAEPVNTPNNTRTLSSTTPNSASNNVQNGQSTTPSSVLSELRSRFQPYGLDRNRSRLAGRSAGNRSSRSSTSSRSVRTWANKIFCLAGPNSNTTPTNLEKEYLFDNQLGANVVITGKKRNAKICCIKIT